MFKLILFLVIISQINCDEDNQTFRDDEIDITTIASKGVVESVADKQKPEKTETDVKDVLKSGVEEVSKKDKEEEKSEPELDSGKEGEKNNDKEVINDKKPIDSNTEEQNKDVIKDEDKKPVTSGEDKNEPELDSEKKDEKKIVNEDDKEIINDKKPIDSNTEEHNKDVIKDEDKKPVISGNEGESGVDKEVVNTNNDKDEKKNEISNGNEIMDSLLALMKKDYANDFDKVSVSDYGPVKNGRWGTVLLHSGSVSGLSNIKRVGDILIKVSDQNKKLISGDIVVNDVKADFKVDAKLFHRISIKNRELKLWLNKALLNVLLEVDLTDKKLVISQLSVKSIEGFGVRSGRLFWPFNKLADSILKSQEDIIKNIMKNEISKYMGKVVQNIKFEEVFAKLF